MQEVDPFQKLLSIRAYVHLSQRLVESIKENKDVKINHQVIDNRYLYSVFDDFSLLV